MPKTGAQTVTSMAAEPAQAVTGGLRIHVDLIYDGVAFNPANLLTALTTQYGAGKVSSDFDTTTHNAFAFRIIP